MEDGQFDDDGPGWAASFRSPMGLAAAADYQVFVADADNHAVRRIFGDGYVETIAGGDGHGFVDGRGASLPSSEPPCSAAAPPAAGGQGRARLRYALRPAAREDACSAHRARTRSDFGARRAAFESLARAPGSRRPMGRRRLRASGILPRPFMLHIPQLFCL